MKTKIQIIQELLDKQAISAADAVVLLTKEVEYVPYNPAPHYPFFPYRPIWQVFPEYRTGGITTNECIINTCTN